VLLIEGRSGSGKSTLAAWLAPRLGARVLAMEDLYQGWDGLEAAGRLLSARILPALISGRPASWRTWDWHLDRPGPVTWLRPGGLVIVEGCGALTAESRRSADLAVALVVDDAVRHRRILARDPEEALPGHRLWAVQERRMLARDPWPPLADLVLPGGVLLPISVPQDDGR
jgi:uridine kinase